MSEIDDVAELAAFGTDRQWWNKHHSCGGCGEDRCHPGVPCTPGERGCRYCANRDGDLTPPAPAPEPIPGQESLNMEELS